MLGMKLHAIVKVTAEGQQLTRNSLIYWFQLYRWPIQMELHSDRDINVSSKYGAVKLDDSLLEFNYFLTYKTYS